MPVIITYDLKKHGRDYRSLHERLKTIGAQWAQRSVWIYHGPLAPTQIRDTLAMTMDANDDLLVAELGSRWATFNSWAASRWLSMSAGFARLMSRLIR